MSRTALGLALLLGGCTPDGGAATADAEPPADAGADGGADVEPGDTPDMDPGTPDASTPDTGAADASAPDTGAADASAPDADAPDAGIMPTPWQPAPGTTWQWQLSGPIDTGLDVEMYDVDLFDAPDAILAELRAAGRIVICYFSAGSHEDWRDDADAFPEAARGEPLDGWPGERWLDIRDPDVRALLAARLDLARARGCDGVEPDNVDGYSNDSGFDLGADDQLDFNRFLAREAHARGLSVGLKNDVDQIEALVDHFDWALNEECAAYQECATNRPFIDAGKAVFHVEYVDDAADGPALAAQVCGAPGSEGFSTLIKTWDLDAWVLACPE